MKRPVADKPIHQATDYPGLNGGNGLSVQIGVDHVAAYYEFDPRCARYAEPNRWPRLSGTPLLPNPPKTRDEYFEWMDHFKLPDELRFTALRAAEPLAESLDHLSKRVVERDLVSGRIDRYKLPEVGKAAAIGQYSDEVVRPYRRTEYRDAYVPTIAIVTAIPTSATNGSGTYCQHVVTLALSVLWACESVGIYAQAAMVQGRAIGIRGFFSSRLPVGYTEVVQGFMLTSPDRVIPARAYGIFLNDDMWMHMKVHVKACRYDYGSQIARMDQRVVEMGYLLNCFATSSGGNAVNWARQVLGADIVIAIGNIADRADAEVSLDQHFTVQQAIRAVAEKAEKL